MSAETLQQIGVLIAFALLMLLVNLKTGTARHWTSSLLKVSTFWLLVAAVGVLVWRVVEVVL